jgi:hypothetical protein
MRGAGLPSQTNQVDIISQTDDGIGRELHPKRGIWSVCENFRPVAHRLEHSPDKGEVVGSSPTGPTKVQIKLEHDLGRAIHVSSKGRTAVSEAVNWGSNPWT